MSKEKGWLLTILSASALLRLLAMGGHDLFFTEARCALLSRLPFPVMLETLRSTETRPPLYYWLLKGWGFISEQEWWLRLLSVVLSLFFILLIYRAACRLFCGRTGLAVAAVAAFSPLLVTSAGSVVSPVSLDCFLGALILLTFVRGLTTRGWPVWLFHGLALGAGAYANIYLLLFIPVEAAFLICYLKTYLNHLVKWSFAALFSLALFLPWMPSAHEQLNHRYGHDDLITESLSLRMTCLFTELSLGRLYAWCPPTPVISLAPAPAEEVTEEEEDPNGLRWLQAVQLVFFGCFFMLAVVGWMTAMDLSGRPLPAHLRVRQTALKALRKKLEDSGATDLPLGSPAFSCANGLPNRQSGILLLSSFVLFFLLAMAAAAFFTWRFEGSELVFLSVPLMILVARGIAAMEWRVMYSSVLSMILASSLVFIFCSSGLDTVSHGAEEAARFLEARFDEVEEDIIVHESPLTYLPIRYYTKGYYDAATYVAQDAVQPILGSRFLHPDGLKGTEDAFPPNSRIWWIRIEPTEDAPREEVPFAESLFNPGEVWSPKEVASMGNLTITLFEQ